MKQNYIPRKLLKIGCLLVLTIVLNSSVSVNAQTTNKIEAADILSSIRANNLDAFDQMRGNLTAERSRFNAELLNVFRDAKLSNLQRCEAAFYLGDMHVAEAVNDLAGDIVLQPILLTTDHLTEFTYAKVAADALVKIGNPSIPAVVRNLAESDNADVRSLSLKVLYRIEGDKDIVQLRLQKAMAAQKDSNKKARLQAALKVLADSSFEK